MIESTCPTCGQRTVEPDAPETVRTIDERFAFEREWDRRWREGRDQDWGTNRLEALANGLIDEDPE